MEFGIFYKVYKHLHITNYPKLTIQSVIEFAEIKPVFDLFQPNALQKKKCKERKDKTLTTFKMLITKYIQIQSIYKYHTG